MLNILIESQYCPNLEYFILLDKADRVLIDQHANYVKQTYRNRCEILGANGLLALTVPVLRGRSKQAMKEVKIDNRQNWQAIHWRSIQSSYGKAPFFEYYYPFFHKIFTQRFDYLLDINHDLLSLCLKLLDIPKKIDYTNQYLAPEDTDYQDLRSFINPKKDFNSRNIYTAKPYLQVFGNDFVPNLSALDLLFCEGPQALLRIRSSSFLNNEQIEIKLR